MKQKPRRSKEPKHLSKSLCERLPHIEQPSYIQRSLAALSLDCTFEEKLRIDQGYGDHQFSLFRLKDRNRYKRRISSIFNAQMQNAIFMQGESLEHCSQIREIINQPKEVYLDQIRFEKQQAEKAAEQPHYCLGVFQELREVEDSLVFHYLPTHEASNWFRVKDKSSSYKPAEFTPKITQEPVVSKKMLKKGFIFVSDNPERKFC